MRLTSSSVRRGFLPRPVLRDDDTAQDEGARHERPEQAPGFHSHERKSVGVHQRHEDAAQEIVERGEKNEGEQARHAGDHANRAGDDRRASARLPRWRERGSLTCTNRRCTKARSVKARAKASVATIPPHATRKPLIAEVVTKPIPVAMPTSPFALSRRSSGTSRVTSVGSAMLRTLPAITPNMTARINSHKAMLSRRRQSGAPESAGRRRGNAA